VDLRADRELEVCVAVLAVDGKGSHLLYCATVNAANWHCPAILLIVMLSTDRVDEVLLAVLTRDVHGLRTLSLCLLLLAARVAASGHGEPLLREEGLLLVRDEVVGFTVAAGQKLATVHLLCLSTATRLLSDLGKGSIGLGLLLLCCGCNKSVGRIALGVEGYEAGLDLRSLFLLLERHDLLLDGE